MEREIVIQKLRSLKPSLEHTHINRMRLFGSAVHDKMGPESDIDILLNFSQTPSLFDMSEIQVTLEEGMGKKVDLAIEEGLYPAFKDRILREAIDV